MQLTSNLITFYNIYITFFTKHSTHQTEEVVTSTDSNQHVKWPTAKRKQTNQPDSEEIVATLDETSHQNMVMEDQETSNPSETRT